MRTMFLSATLAACLVTPALAQTGAAPAYPPYASPPPGYGAAPAYPAYPAAPPASPGYAPAQPGSLPGQTAAPSAAEQTGSVPYEPPSAMPLSHQASNIDQQDTRSQLAPNLPAPQVGPDAGPVAYLQAAQAALAAGQTGETQEALGHAQTRLLDRSVPLGQVNAPDTNPAVTAISEARQALAAGDRARAMQMIETAIQAAQAPPR